MKKIFCFLIVMFVALSVPALAEASVSSLTYHAFKNAQLTDKVIGETLIEMENISDEQTVIKRQKKFNNCLIKDEFILDKELSLDQWTRVCDEEKTDFTAIREGEALKVTGMIKGEPVEKQLEVGSKALHIYPKYSLSKFALSGMPRMKLWTLRRDEMTKLPMQAIRKGVETVSVNGEDVEAIKVYYSIVGKLREKHFNHNYYYRKSDGLFLKKEENSGRIETLIKEE